MEQSNDGFELAKLDLQYRGSGELLGTRQAGESDLPLEILGDIRFVETVKQAAIELLQKNPDLE